MGNRLLNQFLSTSTMEGAEKNTMRIYDLCDVACVHLETTCNPLKAVVPSVFDSFMMLNGSM